MFFSHLSRAKRVALFALCLMMFSLAVTWYEAKKEEWDARSLLQDSLKLKLGVSSAQDVLAVTRGPGRVTDGFEECRAGRGECLGMVAVKNSWLRAVGLAPDLGIGASFAIKNNILVGRYIQMVAIINGNDLHAFVNEQEASSNKPAFRVERSNNRTLLGVVMTPAAGDEFRQRVTDFNLRCLSKIGGCKTMEEMLPILVRKDLTQP
jgi:hypothetical protein